jgi:hypothetical protein
MTSTYSRVILFSALSLALAACSPQPAPQEPAQSPTPAPSSTPPAPRAAPTEPGTAETPPATGQADSAATLGLEGLGQLRIGQAPPPGWSERGAQESPTCRVVSSAQQPGVYAIVLDGKVQRITVGQRSQVKLAEGIGAGASEADVLKWFAGFREAPHAYEAAPAKYLTAPNAGGGDAALRFEIGQDGKVRFIHIGTMPALGYVEGCS